MKIWRKPWFIPIVLTFIILVGGQLYTTGKLTKAETLSMDDIHAQLSTIYNGQVKELVLDDSIYKAKVVKAGSEYAVEVDARSGRVLSLMQTKESMKPDVVLDDKELEVTQEPDLGAVEEPEEQEPEKVTPPAKEPVKETKPVVNKTENEKPNVGKTPAQTKPHNNPQPKPSNKPAKAPVKTVLISENQAAKIAMGQLPVGMIGEVDDVDFEESKDGGYYLVQIDIDTDDDLDEVTYQIHAISGKVMTVTWDD
ncbi:PepSY domain-containing protein [Sporosarcina sp. Sa2YVA2]|uniref:PepSY domain-containing protein n=1 Tax=Sporosarcina quadrami TaxID=2762234 RepID=A0ABR8UBM3_9BACL|nr:PepSY domain-containing protein [Sporosarcina quadrami]MBD7985411.1 PepSY domain-containing protein [Sporosarcina quadrami]